MGGSLETAWHARSDQAAFERIGDQFRLSAKAEEQAAASAVVEDLAPAAGEHIVRKTWPSGFFGTTAHAWLARQQVETLVVVGSQLATVQMSAAVYCIGGDRGNSALTA